MDRYVVQRYRKEVAEHKQRLLEQTQRFEENRKTNPFDPVFLVSPEPETLVNWETEWPQRMWNVGLRGDVALCAQHLQRGANINAGARQADRRNWNYSAVLHAAARGNSYYASVLTEDYAKQNLRPMEGRTCLMAATHENHVDLVKFLLSKNANVHVKDPKNGFTTLHYAAEKDRGEIVTLLLDSKADAETKDKHGQTALIVAAKANSASAAEALLTHAANPCNATTTGTDEEQAELTSLMWAARMGSSRVLKLLLAHSPQQLLDQQTLRYNDKKNDRSALMYACIFKHAACVQMMIDAKCDLNLRDVNGDSALLWAIYKDAAACALPLIEQGADITLIGWQNKSVSEWALQKYKETGHREIMEALQRRRLSDCIAQENRTRETELASRPKEVRIVREVSSGGVYPTKRSIISQLFVVVSRAREDPKHRPNDINVTTHGVYSEQKFANEAVKAVFEQHCRVHDVKWTPRMWSDARGNLHICCAADELGVWSSRLKRDGVGASGNALEIWCTSSGVNDS